MNGIVLRFARKSFGALIVMIGIGALASPAYAVSAGESVSGTTGTSLSLTAGTGAVFASNFSPGNTATASGLLTATDTSPSWTLQVKDTASSNAGKMAAAATACSGSDANLGNPLQVNVTSPLGGVTSAGAVSISGTNQTVASATNQLLAANALTTNYSQTISSSQVMVAGCVYSLTATYTLQ